MSDIFRWCIELPVFNAASDMFFVFVSNKYACSAMGVYFISLAIACFNAVQVIFAIVGNK